MLAPIDYSKDLLELGPAVNTDPEAPFRDCSTYFNDSCQQASVALHKISLTDQTHSHVARWLRRDEWTDHGIIVKPTGMMLQQFLGKQRRVMYDEEGHIKPAFLTLLYQWALNALSAMEFCHSHEIFVADFGAWAAWLASPEENLALTLFRPHHTHCTDEHDQPNIGELRLGPNFSAAQLEPLQRDWHWVGTHLSFTEKTDPFDWATFVYEIATGRHPFVGGRPWLSGVDPAFQHIDATSCWPVLEEEYLGDIVRKCWVHKHYGNATAVKRDLVAFLETKAWDVDAEDNLVSFDATTLPLEPPTPKAPQSPVDPELVESFVSAADDD